MDDGVAAVPILSVSCHGLRIHRDNKTYCYKMAPPFIVFHRSIVIADAAPVAEDYVWCLAVFVKGFLNFASINSKDAFYCSIRYRPSICSGNIAYNITRVFSGFIL